MSDRTQTRRQGTSGATRYLACVAWVLFAAHVCVFAFWLRLRFQKAWLRFLEQLEARDDYTFGHQTFCGGLPR